MGSSVSLRISVPVVRYRTRMSRCPRHSRMSGNNEVCLDTGSARQNAFADCSTTSMPSGKQRSLRQLTFVRAGPLFQRDICRARTRPFAVLAAHVHDGRIGPAACCETFSRVRVCSYRLASPVCSLELSWESAPSNSGR